MCRLLGVVSDRVASIPELVPDELARFEALSAVHPHGWGIAHLAAAGEVAVDREPARASESDAWRAALGSIRTRAATLHIRQASPGMPHVASNTHPFLADGMAFAHNGHAWPNAALETLTTEAFAPVAPPPLEGDTDSERYWSLVRAALADGRSMDLALLDAAGRITAAATATSLNALVLTPDALVAIAWWDAPTIRGAGDGETDRDYRLWVRVAADEVVVASTYVAHDDAAWQELPHGHALIVDVHTLDVRITSIDAVRAA